MASCVRLGVLCHGGPVADETLAEALAGVTCSWVDAPGGATLWISQEDAGGTLGALEAAGLEVVSMDVEPERDWVREAAALRRPVAVGKYLFDPHEAGAGNVRGIGGRRRLEIPAARAFGTGSHESTRLAVRLLLEVPVAGCRVLDAGCGTGTLAFVAVLEGARRVVAFDIDLDAAVATRAQAAANGIPGVQVLAGGPEALRAPGLFGVVVANMLEEELAPLLPALRRFLGPQGVLVVSGQLRVREVAWLATLSAGGFLARKVAAEGEWIGVVAVGA